MLLITILVIMLALLILAGLALLAWELVRAGRFGTFVPEGQIKFIVAGKSLYKVLANIKGYYLDENFNLIEGNTRKSIWQKWLGIYWYGIWPLQKEFVYTFAWTKDAPDSDPSGGFRREPTDVMFWRYAYKLALNDVELAGKIRVNLQILVTIETVNPKKALFDIQPPGAWLPNTLTAVSDALRPMLIEMSFDDLANADMKSVTTRVQEINHRDIDDPRDGLDDAFGVKITEVLIKSPEASDQETEKALQAKRIAQLQAQATIETAKGEAEAIARVGEAKARVIGSGVGAQTILGVSPNVAAHTYAAVQSGAPVGLQTLVGSSSDRPVGVNINTGPKPKDEVPAETH